MGSQRPRPWHNPTPLVGFQPVWIGQFDTFDDWVCHAARALAIFTDSNGAELKAICVDNLGRRCVNGKDFMRARDEGAFPVRYFTSGTVRRRKAQAETIRSVIADQLEQSKGLYVSRPGATKGLWLVNGELDIRALAEAIASEIC